MQYVHVTRTGDPQAEPVSNFHWDIQRLVMAFGGASLVVARGVLHTPVLVRMVLDDVVQ